MKKIKLLVPAVAVLGLGIAATTTATVAWFASNSNVSVADAQAVGAGTMTVGQSTASVLNNFTITPTAITGSQTVAYTDVNGLTYVSVWNGTSYDTLAASTTAAKAAAYTLKATVTYSGSLDSKDSVEALWNSTVSTVTLTLSCSGVSGSTVAGTASVNDIRGVEDADADANGPLAITVGKDDFTWSTYATTAELTFGTIYVALTGNENLVVDSTHLPIYTLQIAASHVLVS